jgi:superfamily II DNA or RNA helicase
MRTLRSRKLRSRLYLDYKGKCAICCKELKKDWHADHRIPYKIIKNTRYENLQPVCKKCNLRKGSKVIKDKNYYNNADYATCFDSSGFRIGQRGAFNCVIDRFLEKQQCISIVLPTRYGKSDVMRMTALELFHREEICCAFLVTPACFLVDQLLNKTKIEDMLNRYKSTFKQNPRVRALEKFTTPIVQNNEHMIGLTTQMLSLNANEIADYIKLLSEKTGKKVVFFIDEVHSLSDKNQWGEAVPKLTEAGATIVVLTATPVRENPKEHIHGFSYSKLETLESKERWIPSNKEHDDPNYIWCKLYNYEKNRIRIDADYEHSFKDALKEGVICHFSKPMETIDVVFDRGDGKEIRISEMTPTQSSSQLGKIVRYDETIEMGCKFLINKLRIWKRANSKIQAIIFCGNDMDGDDDAHAKQIKREIMYQMSTDEFDVVIATSKQDKADEIIAKFAKGHGDILIVKQMASLGLDIPTLKVGLDLSAVRTYAACIQRWMRISTLCGNIKYADFIMPCDSKGINLWNNFIVEQGGEVVVEQSEFIKEEEKARGDVKNKPEFDIKSVEEKLISPSGEEKFEDNEYYEYVLPLIKQMPQLLGVLDTNSILTLAKKIGKEKIQESNNQNSEILDFGEICKRIKDKIEDYSKKLASKKYSYKKNPTLWVKEKRRWIALAKNEAGIYKSTKYENIVNKEKLMMMSNFLDSEINKVKNAAHTSD